MIPLWTQGEQQQAVASLQDQAVRLLLCDIIHLAVRTLLGVVRP